MAPLAPFFSLHPTHADKPRRHHAKYNQHSDDHPDPLHGFFCSFVVEKTHRYIVTFTIEYYHMLDFYQKRKLRTVLNSKITQAILAVCALVLIWNAAERYMIASVMSDRRIAVEQEAALLTSQKEDLEAQVNYLRDARGLEAEMRRQFDIALPGEEVVVILENPESAVVVEPVAPEVVERRWWQW